MFVPCPHCQFLVAHHPQLRPLPAECPRCGRQLEEDIDAAADDADGTSAGQIADNDAGLDTAVADIDDPAAGNLVVEDEVDEQNGQTEIQAIVEADAPDAIASQATTATFVTRTPPNRWTRWRWPLIALLGVLLALQILLADRARLAEDPRWRPLVETVCGALHCSLPAWHEPTAFTMLDRKVRPDPQQAGALRVDATFRNDARWPQAWPALQLALSDADGRVIGSRVFQPTEYLGAAPTTLLSPGQSAQITFLVREPSAGTVAFSFEFR